MLNIGTQNAGDYDAWVKFNGKSGRWAIKGTDGQDQEITPGSFVADLDNIKTGWLLFAAGQAPNRVWDERLDSPSLQPTPNHKRGFSLRLFSNASFNGVVELSSSSMHLCAAINELYEAYSAGKAANSGKLPVVKFTGVTPQKDKHGTNYKPSFVIEKWVTRPNELETQYEQSAASPSATTPAPAAQASSVSEF